MDEKDPPKKNLPTVIPPASVSLSRAKTLIRLTNEVLAKPPDPELLFAAFKAGDVAEVKRLLDAGADPNAANKNGLTALMLAVLREYAEVVKMLLSAGADPNASKPGFNALHLAEAGGNSEIVRILEEAGEKE
ncbi:MAG: ankyrin repeat domain-containing protein [Gammaproteobacteria bacterium]